MLELVSFYSLAFSLNVANKPLDGVQLNPVSHSAEIVSELPWYRVDAEPYETPYEREVNGEDDEGEDRDAIEEREEDFEEMRRRDYEEYEQRSRGYEEDYDRSDRYEEELPSEYYERREILEERKREIEEEIEELDRRYRY